MTAFPNPEFTVGDLETKTILLVEDDPDVARGVTVRLQANGYRVVHATNATLALTIAALERPDLVIMDVGLPGQDGHYVMERLARSIHTAMIPVVFLTARGQEETARKAFEAGAVGFMTKPYRGDELIAMVGTGLAAVA
ncbi:MAG: response regulator [Gemmatimonadetes bacterium]|nr:response regulator [Gemmatimonadota bacterium]NNK63133.1 response regulator [Gemmatimonadota bacterium]